jgi:hypothetical protein
VLRLSHSPDQFLHRMIKIQFNLDILPDP